MKIRLRDKLEYIFCCDKKILIEGRIIYTGKTAAHKTQVTTNQMVIPKGLVFINTGHNDNYLSSKTKDKLMEDWQKHISKTCIKLIQGWRSNKIGKNKWSAYEPDSVVYVEIDDITPIKIRTPTIEEWMKHKEEK